MNDFEKTENADSIESTAEPEATVPEECDIAPTGIQQDPPIVKSESLIPAIEKKKRAIYMLISLFLTAITAVLGIYVTILSRDNGTRYFSDIQASSLLCLSLSAAITFDISAIFVFKGSRSAPIQAKVNQSSWIELITVPSILLPAYLAFKDVEGGSLATVFCVSAVVLASACIIAAFTKSPSLKVIKSYLEVLFCILIITSLYLDLVVELNSPYKLLIQFAAAIIILSALADARLMFSRCSAKLFVFAKLTTITLCTLSAAVNITCFAYKGPIQDQAYLFYSLFFAAKSICTLIEYPDIKTVENDIIQ